MQVTLAERIIGFHQLSEILQRVKFLAGILIILLRLQINTGFVIFQSSESFYYGQLVANSFNQVSKLMLLFVTAIPASSYSTADFWASATAID